MIDILFGTYGGSNTWYGLCNTLDFWEELDRKNLFITMDEDDSAYLLEWVFEMDGDMKCYQNHIMDGLILN